ncbi:MAG: Stk1 family PASTA domain-containing Ser/Thr kinase [Bacilli bacterium]|jgi:serine/threonine protein kinase|nr:Stk1 family PASTA domain-containing Ser/Thr kinase [Bacilli bacterium]
MIMRGQKISDRYQIIKSIGEGGMANVYLAYDTILDRNVAVKILRGDLSNDEKFVRRFQREALAASSLAHQNIVEVYDVGEDNGEYYIVMEYIEGKHLKNLLKKRGKLTLSEAVDIMMQITDGMSVAHDSYIIHRDIKPQNIMILENGLVKITDFGIAMAMNATQLTQTNSVMGSVHYLPPEQASGQGSTLQSDIYSMGIVMFELLTGELPFKGDNAVEIALKHLKEPIVDIREKIPNVQNSIVNIIKRATAKNPKNRYNDAREMYEDLKTCLDDARAMEPIISFKYPENDTDDTKIMKMVKKEKENIPKKVETEEVVAKKITGDDLKKQNKLLIILAFVFTGLIVGITSVVVLIPIITNGKQATIPDVSNLSVTDAITKLQDEGFKVADKQEEISSTEIEKGKVVKTNPAIGSKRKSGTEITLYVSLGDTQITIEDYTGESYLEIKGKLEALGLQVMIDKKDVEEGTETDYEDGKIIDQSSKPDEKLSLGDKITLYIPNIISKYPNFTDGTFSVKDIEDFADTYQLELTIDYVETTEHDPGTIFYQSRPEGYTIVAGQKFSIKVAQVAPDDEDGGEDECLEGLC